MNNYSIKSITKIIINNILLIIILALLFGCLFGVVAKSKKVTTYTATRSIIITHNMIKRSTIASDRDLIPTYQDILKDQSIADNARNYLPKKIKKQYSTNDIQESINSTSRPDSLVINVHAKTKDAKVSTEIVNAVTKSFKKELPKIDGQAGRVQLLSKARVKDADSFTKPSIKKYTALGIALGTILGMVIAFTTTTYSKIMKNNKDR